MILPHLTALALCITATAAPLRAQTIQINKGSADGVAVGYPVTDRK